MFERSGKGGGGGVTPDIFIFIHAGGYRSRSGRKKIKGKVLSEKSAYKSVQTALLLSNVIDADHQNSCLFTNKGHFSSPLWVLIGVLANFYG